MKMLCRAALTLLFFISSQALSADETPVGIIRLAAPLDQAEIELSGLTWCDDKLVLMPQYPERFADHGYSYFYYLERQQIHDYLDRVSAEALQATPISIDDKELRAAASIFDGFEAIACNGNKIWLSIEVVSDNARYQSFVVPGSISFDNDAGIQIDLNGLTLLSTQSNLKNMGDEAIVMQGDDVLAIHEINDPRAVENPKVRQLTRKTHTLTELQFPHIPFRITDATELDKDNRFWVINYKYSGDKFSRDAKDPLSEKYGQGESHKKYYNVERLVELKLEHGQVSLLESPPIQLEMNDVEGRNWEGLVRLENRGFLLVTDKHPSTLLGFVPHPK